MLTQFRKSMTSGRSDGRAPPRYQAHAGVPEPSTMRAAITHPAHPATHDHIVEHPNVIHAPLLATNRTRSGQAGAI